MTRAIATGLATVTGAFGDASVGATAGTRRAAAAATVGLSGRRSSPSSWRTSRAASISAPSTA